jgi:hypothetical protein
MEIITEAFVQAWWWFQATDPAVVVSVLVSLFGFAGLASWITQYWKRRYNIDLLKWGEVRIIGFLSFLSSLFALGDWYLLNDTIGSLVHVAPWLAGAGAVIYQLATLLHRIHVSPAYAKVEQWLHYIVERVDQTRQTKYAPPAKPTDDKMTFN